MLHHSGCLERRREKGISRIFHKRNMTTNYHFYLLNTATRQMARSKNVSLKKAKLMEKIKLMSTYLLP